MSIRTGESKTLRAAATYAANDTYYACTNTLTCYGGADTIRLTIAAASASAGNVTVKAEVYDGVSAWSQIGGDLGPIAVGSGESKILVLPVGFSGGDIVRISFKASAGAGSASLSVHGLAYVRGELTDSDIAVDTLTSATDTVIQLTDTSAPTIIISGSASGCIVRTPNATSLTIGWTRKIKNLSSEFIKIDNGAGGTLFEFVGPGESADVALSTVSAAGEWISQRYKSTYIQYLVDDFESTPPPVGWQPIGSGTGATVAYGASAFRLSTGTTSTGYYCVSRAAYYQHKQTNTPVRAMLFQSIVNTISAAASVAEDYWLDCVNGTANSNTEHTRGFGFRLNRAVTGNNNWQAVVINSSTPTYSDTGVSVATSAQNTVMTAIRNSAGTRIDFYINKALVVTMTSPGTTIPAVPVGPSYRIIKTAGSTAAYFDVDTYRTNYVYDPGTQV